MRRRRPPTPAIPLPRLDGSSWPSHRVVGGAGFDVSTLYELGYREGFEPPAHEIAEQLLTEVMPMLPLGNPTPEDAPYVGRILMVAAQVGAGIGLMEARTFAPEEHCSDHRIHGVLWAALRDLPAVAAPQRRAAAYLMQCGYYVARTGDDSIPGLLATLRTDLDD